jgi:hypothetical protein
MEQSQDPKIQKDRAMQALLIVPLKIKELCDFVDHLNGIAAVSQKQPAL